MLLVMLLLAVIVPLMRLAVDVRPTNSVTEGVELPETVLLDAVLLTSPILLEMAAIFPVETVIVVEYDKYVTPVGTASPPVIGAELVLLKTDTKSEDDCARTRTVARQLSPRT